MLASSAAIHASVVRRGSLDSRLTGTDARRVTCSSLNIPPMRFFCCQCASPEAMV
jgi:hypothetical protein